MQFSFELTPAERDLVDRLTHGLPADLQADAAAGSDPAALPAIRAVVVAEICQQLGAGRGAPLVITGAHVTGTLDLRERVIARTLKLTHCVFDGAIELDGATCRTLVFDGSTLTAFNADWLEASGSVLMRNGCTATGGIRLFGATIGGMLDLSDAVVRGGGDAALLGAAVRAAAIKLSNIQVEGVVSFQAARVANNFNASGATIEAPGKTALNLERLETGGYVFLKRLGQAPRAARITGTVRLYRAVIGANVECDGVTLSQPIASGVALDALGLTVRGSLFLRDGFDACGHVRLDGAQVTGDLDCSGASFRNPSGDALTASAVQVGQALWLSMGRLPSEGPRPAGPLGEPTRIEGRVDLRGVTVEGDLEAIALRIRRDGGVAFDARGAHIKGDLWLHEAAIHGETQWLGLQIDGRLSMQGATLSNPDGASLMALGLRVRGSVLFGGGRDMPPFAAEGEVVLSQAEIGGHLDCSAASFRTTRGATLRMYGATVRGDLYLRDGFSSTGGELILAASRIDGSLFVRDATLKHAGAVALNASRLVVGGPMSLGERRPDGSSGPVYIRGQLLLSNATVGALDFTDVSIQGAPVAVDAAGLVSKGHVALETGTDVAGAVSFANARIANAFRMVRSRLSSADGAALTLDRAAIDGGVTVESVEVDGSVSLAGVRCSGDISLRDTDFKSAAFVATGMVVAKGSFRARRCRWTHHAALDSMQIEGTLAFLESAFPVMLDLRHTRAGLLCDDEASWAEHARFEGFTYGAFENALLATASRRLAWLGRQSPDDFTPETYDQVARTLRQMGRDEEAREVAIARKEKMLSRRGFTLLNLPLRWSIGHGYKPWRAVGLMLVLFLLGGAIVDVAARHGAMRAMPGVDEKVAKAVPLQPWVYAIDLLLPAVDLQQDRYWFLNVAAKGGAFVRGYLWIHVGLGWILAALLLATVTGLIKRE